MGLKMVTVLFTVMLLLRESNGSMNIRHTPNGDACSLEKYEAGDGAFNLGKYKIADCF